LESARAIVRDPTILQQLEEELDYDCERLRSFLLAAQIIDEISLRSKDLIVGVGEKLSCRIVAAVLRDRVSLTAVPELDIEFRMTGHRVGAGHLGQHSGKGG
jgi:aspartokinase